MRRSLLLVLAFVMLPTMGVAQPRRDVAFHQVARAVVHRYAPIAYPDGSYRFRTARRFRTFASVSAMSATFNFSRARRSIKRSFRTPRDGRRPTA